MSSNGHGGRPFISGDARAKQWQPGQSGNAGGRPRGFARLIREETRDGAELVEFALTVFRNGSVRQRVWAAEYLSDRGFGRPVQVNTIRAEDLREMCQAMALAAHKLLSPEDYARVESAWRELVRPPDDSLSAG